MTAISRPDLWEKARENVEAKAIGGLWVVYDVWREYWKLLKEAEKDGKLLD